MAHFNWFDVVLVMILVASVVSGLRAGFARVVIGLLATIVGFIAGFWCYRIVAEKILPYVHTPTIANVLGFFIIFLAVVILGAIIGAVMSRLFRWFGLSWINHLLGGFAGALRGILTIAILIAVLIAFTPSPPPRFLDNSSLLPYATQISVWLASVAPRELKDAFDQQLENIKQFWTPQERRRAREV